MLTHDSKPLDGGSQPDNEYPFSPVGSFTDGDNDLACVGKTDGDCAECAGSGGAAPAAGEGGDAAPATG